jgi:nucleotide-binding universal stress UspA family protein
MMTPDNETGSPAGTESNRIKTNRIVVGIDGSPASAGALEWAARQAELTKATLDIIMTWDWPTGFGWSVPFPDDYDPAEGVQQTLELATASLRTTHPTAKITARVVQGHPAPVLVVASHGASLLVIGSRGHGEFVGMLIGSVSEYCATNAHCPVLIHRPIEV